MKKHTYSSIFLLLSCVLILPFLQSCFKEQVIYQQLLQDALLNPSKAGKCWKLIRQSDTLTYKYYKKYKEFQAKYVRARDINYLYYTSAIDVEEKLSDNFYDVRVIDNSIGDCSRDRDVDEIHHLYFDKANYPKFNYQYNDEYLATNNIANQKKTSAAYPNILDTSFYYHEELYFQKDGRFLKKIYFDTSCNAIQITGKWVFRTPFANMQDFYDESALVSEIILDYDHATLIGLPPAGNVYRITFVSTNYNLISLSQVNVQQNITPLGIRRNYTYSLDNIIHAQNLEDINKSFDANLMGKLNCCQFKGMVQNVWKHNCNTFDGNGGNDKMEIMDAPELVEKIRAAKLAIYVAEWPRCAPKSSSSNCPKYCSLDVCGKFKASRYDSDNSNLLGTHSSILSVTSDSSVLTITNFNNMGESVNISMPNYAWNNCYNYSGFDKYIDGKHVLFVSFNVQVFNNVNMLIAEFSVDGTSYYIHYEP